MTTINQMNGYLLRQLGPWTNGSTVGNGYTLNPQAQTLDLEQLIGPYLNNQTGFGSGANVLPPVNQQGTGTMPDPTVNEGVGLHDIKVSSEAKGPLGEGGKPLDLKEDANGNLWNSKGKSVGHRLSDGSIEFNSSQAGRDAAAQLETGGSNWFSRMFSSDSVHGTKESNGDTLFSSDQVDVSAGDLPNNGTTMSPLLAQGTFPGFASPFMQSPLGNGSNPFLLNGGADGPFSPWMPNNNLVQV